MSDKAQGTHYNVSGVRDHAVTGLWHAPVRSARAVHVEGHEKKCDI